MSPSSKQQKQKILEKKRGVIKVFLNNLVKQIPSKLPFELLDDNNRYSPELRKLVENTKEVLPVGSTLRVALEKEIDWSCKYLQIELKQRNEDQSLSAKIEQNFAIFSSMTVAPSQILSSNKVVNSVAEIENIVKALRCNSINTVEVNDFSGYSLQMCKALRDEGILQASKQSLSSDPEKEKLGYQKWCLVRDFISTYVLLAPSMINGGSDDNDYHIDPFCEVIAWFIFLSPKSVTGTKESQQNVNAFLATILASRSFSANVVSACTQQMKVTKTKKSISAFAYDILTHALLHSKTAETNELPSQALVPDVTKRWRLLVNWANKVAGRSDLATADDDIELDDDEVDEDKGDINDTSVDKSEMIKFDWNLMEIGKKKDKDKSKKSEHKKNVKKEKATRKRKQEATIDSVVKTKTDNKKSCKNEKVEAKATVQKGTTDIEENKDIITNDSKMQVPDEAAKTKKSVQSSRKSKRKEIEEVTETKPSTKKTRKKSIKVVEAEDIKVDSTANEDDTNAKDTEEVQIEDKAVEQSEPKDAEDINKGIEEADKGDESKAEDETKTEANEVKEVEKEDKASIETEEPVKSARKSRRKTKDESAVEESVEETKPSTKKTRKKSTKVVEAEEIKVAKDDNINVKGGEENQVEEIMDDSKAEDETKAETNEVKEAEKEDEASIEIEEPAKPARKSRRKTKDGSVTEESVEETKPSTKKTRKKSTKVMESEESEINNTAKDDGTKHEDSENDRVGGAILAIEEAAKIEEPVKPARKSRRKTKDGSVTEESVEETKPSTRRGRKKSIKVVENEESAEEDKVGGAILPIEEAVKIEEPAKPARKSRRKVKDDSVAEDSVEETKPATRRGRKKSIKVVENEERKDDSVKETDVQKETTGEESVEETKQATRRGRKKKETASPPKTPGRKSRKSVLPEIPEVSEAVPPISHVLLEEQPQMDKNYSEESDTSHSSASVMRKSSRRGAKSIESNEADQQDDESINSNTSTSLRRSSRRRKSTTR